MSIAKLKTSNTFSAALEFLFDVLLSFFVYKYIIKNLGMAALGVWALAISFTSLTSIGSSGFANSAVKFVSKYAFHNNYEKISKVVSTIAITVFAFGFFLVVLVRALLAYNYSVILSPEEYTALSKILNIVFTSFIITSVARVFLSSLDGLNLIYLRSRVGITSKFIYAISNIILVPLYGLTGLALAQLVLGITMLILSLTLLKTKTPIKLLSRKPFDRSIFKEVFSYGAYFQLTSILQVLSDPLTRFYLKSMGGLYTVGLFEVIYKLFFQFRQLIIVVMNTYVPIVAHKFEFDRASVKKIYLPFFDQVMAMSLFGMTIMYPFLPIIFSFFNIPQTGLSVSFVVLLSIGLYVNLIASSAFIFNLGIGNIRQNTLSAVVFSVTNITASYFLGKSFGAIGVISGWALAHIVSSAFLLFQFFKVEKIKLTEVMTVKDLIVHLILILCMLVIILLQAKITIYPALLASAISYGLFTVTFMALSSKFRIILFKFHNMKHLFTK
jgi:O-antigen/teichoic acid export membrane protein